MIKDKNNKIKIEVKSVQNKKWYKSLTLWINTIGLIIALLTDIKSILSSNQILTIGSLINIVLRFITKTSINK